MAYYLHFLTMIRTSLYNYVTASDVDKEWGIYLNTAGYAHVKKGEEYPLPGHPSDYNFSTATGRVLYEYQINYITEGYGLIENRSGIYRITPGTLIILKPEEWHRYRPLKSTGWKEHFIGFNGYLASVLLNDEIFQSPSPLVNIGFVPEIFQIFEELRSVILQEKSAYQHICMGLTSTLIAKIISSKRNDNFEGKEIEQKIQLARIILRDKINENISMENLANNLNIGYSHFRQMFKKYTGMAPLQYHLQLRIKKAEELLLTTRMPIKQIADELGFETLYYFSRVFKIHTGHAPSKLRKQ